MKVVKSGEALICASVNLYDDDENAGFEWRKIDAPDVIPSNSKTAYVYDGLMEGKLKNLDTSSYYKIRPFYKDINDKYVYGEWIGFDPSDFSYFEPTVHTYPAENITDNSVTLKGSALSGSDDIISQGFQYWITDSEQNITAQSTDNEIITVDCNGELMIIEIDGLNPGSNYAFRSFVLTETGYTYGEEHQFKTTDESGVDNIITDNQDIHVIGYYDILGRKYTSLQQGINIILYSDGTSKKVIGK